VGILTEDMQRVVREQRLGFHATVNEDGTPNLSPKGTTGVWDGDHLFFVDVRSPRSVARALARWVIAEHWRVLGGGLRRGGESGC